MGSLDYPPCLGPPHGFTLGFLWEGRQFNNVPVSQQTKSFVFGGLGLNYPPQCSGGRRRDAFTFTPFKLKLLENYMESSGRYE